MTGRHAQRTEHTDRTSRRTGVGQERPSLTDEQASRVVSELAALTSVRSSRKVVDMDRVLTVAKRRAVQRRNRRRATVTGIVAVLLAVAIASLHPLRPSLASPVVYAGAFVLAGLVVLGMWVTEFSARSRGGASTLDGLGNATHRVLRAADQVAVHGDELLRYQEWLTWAADAANGRAEDCRATGQFESEAAFVAFGESLRSQAARIGALGTVLTSEAASLADRVRTSRLAGQHATVVATAEISAILRPPARRQALDEHAVAAAQCRALALSLPFVLKAEKASAAALADAGEIAESVEAAMERVERLCWEALRGSRQLLRASDELSQHATALEINGLTDGRGRRLAARLAVGFAAGVVPGGLPRLVHAAGYAPGRPGMRRVHRRRLRRMSSRAAFLATLDPETCDGRRPIVRATWSALAEGLRHTEEFSNAV